MLLAGMGDHHLHLISTREDEVKYFHAVARRAACDPVPAIAGGLLLLVPIRVSRSANCQGRLVGLLLCRHQVLNAQSNGHRDLQQIGDGARYLAPLEARQESLRQVCPLAERRERHRVRGTCPPDAGSYRDCDLPLVHAEGMTRTCSLSKYTCLPGTRAVR